MRTMIMMMNMTMQIIMVKIMMKMPIKMVKMEDERKQHLFLVLE